MKRFLLGLIALGGLAFAQNLGNVAMVFSEGAKTDPTFNGIAYNAAVKSVEQFRGRMFDFEPAEPTQIAGAIRRFAEEKFSLIIGLGFATEAGVTANAKEFKDQRFALIDTVSDQPNVASYIFRENEGTYWWVIWPGG